MDTIRIGIVGSGYMGRTYAEALARHTSGARAVAVAVGRRAPELAADYDLAVESSVEALVARPDIDAVILATPEQMRLAQVQAAAAAGKHVLSEKPFAPSVAQADAMIAACREAGVSLMVCQTLRYRGTMARAKQLVDSGAIGRVLQIRTFAMHSREDFLSAASAKPWIGAEDGGGHFYDQAVHNFDYMRWLTGSEASEVFAYIDTQSDLAFPAMSIMAQVRYASGAIAQLNICFELPDAAFPEHGTRFMVVGDQGLLEMDQYSNVRLGKQRRWEVIWEQPPFDFLNDPNSPIRMQAHAAMLQEFIASLREGRPPAVRGEDGRAAVELCEACVRSARSGLPVRLPLDVAPIEQPLAGLPQAGI
ncbi:MAG: Gfo/Idh/MocA family oxidoreductase [Oscillochloris sp.]|nr:Gfo/Idh/MocA family oxidoreductase [Oscillochloris sp.]